MSDNRYDSEWTIKMLEIELADERDLTAERTAAVLKMLDEIVANRESPRAVTDLAISAKNVLRNGWV